MKALTEALYSFAALRSIFSCFVLPASLAKSAEAERASAAVWKNRFCTRPRVLSCSRSLLLVSQTMSAAALTSSICFS